MTDHKALRSIATSATQPGPWTYYKNDDGDWIVLDADGMWVANCGRVESEARYVAAMSPGVVVGLLEEIERLRKSDDEMGLAAITAHAEYKERRNAQFAAYEFAHRATIAYLLDRAEQYSNSSGYRALFDELVEGIAEWQHVRGAEAGEYGDLEKRVGRIVGKRREGRTETEKLQEQVASMREQLAALRAARDEACEIASRYIWAPVRQDELEAEARIVSLKAVGQ